MSIGGIMRTSVSGMNAQANRLSAVSENIANANTTGYKRQTTEFSSMVLASGPGQFNSGVVESQTRQLISQQGGLTYTTNSSSSQAIDLAIQGRGFLVVGDGDGGSFLTRAGSFVKNGNGDLVNAAGFVLQGYPLPMGDTNGVANGFAGLQNVNLNGATLRLKPTDAGILTVNLPKHADVTPTLVAGTGTDASAATRTQTNAFEISGTTLSDGDRVSFTVTIDGTAHDLSVDAVNQGGTYTISAQSIADAINGVAPDTAMVDITGRIILTSPTTGASSNLALSNVALTAAAGEPISGAVEGLVAFSAITGQDAIAAQYVGTLPSLNAPDAKPTAKESLVAYTRTGDAVILDVYMTKTGPDTWEYAVYDRATSGTGSTAPFPYSSGPLTTGPMAFDADGQLVTPAGGNFSIQIPDGELMNLSLAGTTQHNAAFQTLAAATNGNPPEAIDQIKVGEDGIISAVFKSGTEIPLYKVPLALVESPDNMTARSGNVYSAGVESGTVLVGFGGESGLGSLVAGALESSTVDLASELTTMIESQRSYTANSKVFQTGSEILDVLVNLKR